MAKGKMSVSADLDITDDGKWIKVITPYNEAFIQALKDEIPYGKRVWNKAPDKFWTVDISYMDLLVTICKKHYQEVRYLFDIDGGEDPYATLLILPEAPVDLIKSAYRILSKEYHPDHGGSQELSAKLNIAMEKIRQERQGL